MSEFLTVAQFIKDLSALPQDIEIVAALHGCGLSIPIVQIDVVQSIENSEGETKTLAIVSVSPMGAYRAVELMAKQAKESLPKEGDIN